MPRQLAHARPIQVSERVWWVGNGGWGGTPRLSMPGDCNVYLVDGGDELALIDTGVTAANPAIVSNVRKAGFDPRRIRWIFVTHAHLDHTKGARWLRSRTGARIAAGNMTARALKLPEPLLVGAMRPFAKLDFKPFKTDRVLKDGEVVTVGDLVMKTIYTPGHTIDAVCFLAKTGGRKILFSGDTLIGNQPRADFGRVFKGMLGWLDGHWGTPLTEYMRTLRGLSRLRPDLTLPGHGIPNDARTTLKAIDAGIRNLKRIVDDPDTLIMFAISR